VHQIVNVDLEVEFDLEADSITLEKQEQALALRFFCDSHTMGKPPFSRSSRQFDIHHLSFVILFFNFRLTSQLRVNILTKILSIYLKEVLNV